MGRRCWETREKGSCRPRVEWCLQDTERTDSRQPPQSSKRCCRVHPLSHGIDNASFTRTNAGHARKSSQKLRRLGEGTGDGGGGQQSMSDLNSRKNSRWPLWITRQGIPPVPRQREYTQSCAQPQEGGRLHLGLEEAVEVPEAALDPSTRRHLLEAHVHEHLPELRPDLRDTGTAGASVDKAAGRGRGAEAQGSRS